MRDTKQPLPPALRALDRQSEQACRRGLVLYPRRPRSGHSGDHLPVAPPVMTAPAQVAQIVEKLTDARVAFAAGCNLGGAG